MTFEAALQIVLEFEGGLVNHPDDPGGLTNYGITQAVYDKYRVDNGLGKQSVEFISEHEMSGIYRLNYWIAAGCEQLPPHMALIVFDSAVNHGVGRAREWLQETRVLAEYAAIRGLFYGNLKQFNVFGRGWMRRLAHVTVYAARLQEELAPQDGWKIVAFDSPLREGDDVLIRVSPTSRRVWIRPDAK